VPRRFDPDALEHLDWEIVEDIDAYPEDPWGLPWRPGTPTLVKLIAWASWGFLLHLNGYAPRREHDTFE
jgi:hypothetical protein